ncbi:MAG: PEP-CTERM sorting domain-containing protein [Pirellulaceae bacterium]|nr:PEP-CTERM sorting domain-containing protein [Planctomycetales bacterium]
MRTLLIVLSVTASAVAQEDYRWRILGDKGEEFVVTLYGATPYMFMPDPGVSGYNISHGDLKYSFPYPIELGGGPGTPLIPIFDFSYPFGTDLVDTQIVIAPADRIELEFFFYGSTTNPEADNFDGSLAPWVKRTWFMAVNTTPVARYSGNIVSVTRLSVPEPSTLSLLAFAGLSLLSRRQGRVARTRCQYHGVAS